MIASLVLSLVLALSAGMAARMELAAASARPLALVMALTGGEICGHGGPAEPGGQGHQHCLACVLGGPAPVPHGPALACRAARARPLRRARMRRLAGVSRPHPCPRACGPPVPADCRLAA
ncbi:hypothetical protein KTN05_13765 [Paracoccus sp. Z118]|uniref:hypothetical protein n=1 Tax=Paracoccus sp. Z118 TaxID=2851017 RepID=UPI001C2BFD88|nr:hypothetical protein [Paracoccus sp. Z118]MBV0892910.1 hypothetical protein [Paracoccus sp. Z118]